MVENLALDYTDINMYTYTYKLQYLLIPVFSPSPPPTFLWQYSSFGMSVGSARGGIQVDPIADTKRGQKPVPC
jgi:hypothetical protein